MAKEQEAKLNELLEYYSDDPEEMGSEDDSHYPSMEYVADVMGVSVEFTDPYGRLPYKKK